MNRARIIEPEGVDLERLTATQANVAAMPPLDPQDADIVERLLEGQSRRAISRELHLDRRIVRGACRRALAAIRIARARAAVPATCATHYQ